MTNLGMKSLVASLICLCVLMQSVSATNYYINNRFGNDDNAGTSIEAPWVSLTNLGIHKFLPGDSILFARGSYFTGGIVFNSSGTEEKPIVISSYNLETRVIIKTEAEKGRAALGNLFMRYGAGPAPSFSNPSWSTLNGNIFHIKGSYIVIDGLYFHDNVNPPGSSSRNKNVQKMGAIYFALGTHNNIVRKCEFFHTPVAIKIKGTHNLIAHNYFHDATTPMAYTWGPIAIMIVKPYNEIAYNRFRNYGSYGGHAGSDGGVIELDGVDNDFDGRCVNIHHNTAINTEGFLELAGNHVDSITVAYNLSEGTDQFIGGGSMKNIFVYNNTIIRTGETNVDRAVFWTFKPEETHVTVRNNIFVLPTDIKVFGSVTKQKGHRRSMFGKGNEVHDHNLYFSVGNPDPIGVAQGQGDVVADPLFIDPQNGNFRLRKNSPAINKGVPLGYKNDLDGYPVPRDGKVDMGAYEY